MKKIYQNQYQETKYQRCRTVEKNSFMHGRKIKPGSLNRINNRDLCNGEIRSQSWCDNIFNILKKWSFLPPWHFVMHRIYIKFQSDRVLAFRHILPVESYLQRTFPKKETLRIKQRKGINRIRNIDYSRKKTEWSWLWRELQQTWESQPLRKLILLLEKMSKTQGNDWHTMVCRNTER